STSKAACWCGDGCSADRRDAPGPATTDGGRSWPDVPGGHGCEATAGHDLGRVGRHSVPPQERLASRGRRQAMAIWITRTDPIDVSLVVCSRSRTVRETGSPIYRETYREI